MSCSAKLPIYSLYTAAIFPEHAALVMVSLYFLGIPVGILMAILLKSSVFKGEAVPFVMELPYYTHARLSRMCSQLLWERPAISFSAPLRSSLW
jgi:Fe2+ transport system protein B